MSKHQQWWGLAFCLPALIFLSLFYVYPIALSLRLSFYNVSWGQKTFVGLQNFQAVLSEEYFWGSVRVTLKFFAGLMVMTQIVAFVLSYWLLKFGDWFRGFCLTYYHIPGIFSAITTVAVWRWFYRYPDGLFNTLLGSLRLPQKVFLGDLATSSWAIIFAMTGAMVGGTVLLWTAAMAQVPKEVIEAAELDGADGIRALRYIIAPLTNRMRLYLLITNMVGAAHVWEHPFFFTSGGPVGSSATLMYRVYTVAFEERRIGEGMAMTVILIAATILITALFLRKLRDVLE